VYPCGYLAGTTPGVLVVHCPVPAFDRLLRQHSRAWHRCECLALVGPLQGVVVPNASQLLDLIRAVPATRTTPREFTGWSPTVCSTLVGSTPIRISRIPQRSRHIVAMSTCGSPTSYFPPHTSSRPSEGKRRGRNLRRTELLPVRLYPGRWRRAAHSDSAEALAVRGANLPAHVRHRAKTATPKARPEVAMAQHLCLPRPSRLRGA
jgi:hypothetical protein